MARRRQTGLWCMRFSELNRGTPGVPAQKNGLPSCPFFAPGRVRRFVITQNSARGVAHGDLLKRWIFFRPVHKPFRLWREPSFMRKIPPVDKDFRSNDPDQEPDSERSEEHTS